MTGGALIPRGRDATIVPHAEAAAMADTRAINRDRRWFAKHPRRRFRARFASELEAIGYRRGKAAEGHALPDGGIVVAVVRQVRRGYRLRHLYHIPCGDGAMDIELPDDDRALEQVVEGVTGLALVDGHWELCGFK